MALQKRYLGEPFKFMIRSFFLCSVYFIRRSHRMHGKNSLEVIIFSKDRAMQLHALLSSYFDKIKSPVNIYVFYYTSNSDHQQSYEDLASNHHNPKVSFIKQQSKVSFRRDFLKLLSSLVSEKIMLLVDDVLFINETDISEYAKADLTKYIPSLRMGCNIDYDIDLTPNWLPRINEDHKIEWNWDQGSYAWGYPLSLDGHVFLRKEILYLTRWINFKGPNSLETNMQSFSCLYRKHKGLAEKESVIVNIMWNKVQEENNNLYGDVHQDFLLELWHKGYKIDWQQLSGLMHKCTHVAIPLPIAPRNVL